MCEESRSTRKHPSFATEVCVAQGGEAAFFRWTDNRQSLSALTIVDTIRQQVHNDSPYSLQFGLYEQQVQHHGRMQSNCVAPCFVCVQALSSLSSSLLLRFLKEPLLVRLVSVSVQDDHECHFCHIAVITKARKSWQFLHHRSAHTHSHRRSQCALPDRTTTQP